jgi:hypothetical protein
MKWGSYKKRFRDRYDGRRVRSMDPFFRLIPYIMQSRVDSQVFFDDTIDITRVESYLRGKRNAGMKNLGFLHIVIAAIVRTLSQKPGLNRFVAGQRIYARNEILISLAVKKDLKEESPETTVKIKFEPADTIYDVMEKVNKVIEENKKEEVNNDTDKTAKIISLCPGFLIKFIVWFMAKLDYHRIMPKIINRVSPFHTSIFITDLGSVGIQSAYHHIYEFGTTSIFVAFGTKKKERVIDADNNVVEKRTINLRVVADERIVDGHYYARAFRLFNRYMLNPERLEVPPEKVVEDLA